MIFRTSVPQEPHGNARGAFFNENEHRCLNSHCISIFVQVWEKRVSLRTSSGIFASLLLLCRHCLDSKDRWLPRSVAKGNCRWYAACHFERHQTDLLFELVPLQKFNLVGMTDCVHGTPGVQDLSNLSPDNMCNTRWAQASEVSECINRNHSLFALWKLHWVLPYGCKLQYTRGEYWA